MTLHGGFLVGIGFLTAGVCAALACIRILLRRLQDRSHQIDELKSQMLEWNRRLEETAFGRTQDLEDIHQRLQETYLETVTALVEALSAKDNYLYSHSQNVATYAQAIAQEIGFSKERIHRLVHGCKLHDVGKIAIPDSILLKEDSLTGAELEIIKQHPTWGARILQPLTFMKDITEMVHQEHERWDGQGYPQGLKGEQIRLEARIIAVADALDAMTSQRPYRQRITIEQAGEELSRSAGTQFDPKVVEACTRAIESGRLTLSSKQHP